MSFGALAFLSPWLLAALLALPVIYWLLRAVPPRPAQVEFPPTRILVGLENQEKTPAKTPWWLTLIRLLAAALVILALAEPVLNPSKEAGAGGRGSGRARRRQRLGGRVALAGTRQDDRPLHRRSRRQRQTCRHRRDRRREQASRREDRVPERRAKHCCGTRTAAVRTRSGGRIVGARKCAQSRKQQKPEHRLAARRHRPKTATPRDIGKKLAALAGNGTFAVLDETKGHEPLGLIARLGDKGKLQALVLRPAVRNATAPSMPTQPAASGWAKRHSG